MGSLEGNHRVTRILTVDNGVMAAGAEYALAPEHPYPAALTENLAVLTWFSSSADSLGIADGRIGVMGFSAGAYKGMVHTFLKHERMVDKARPALGEAARFLIERLQSSPVEVPPTPIDFARSPGV